MIADPHDDSFIAKNLDEEQWFVYQQDKRTLELAEAIKETVNQGLIAKIKNSLLYELGLEVCFKAATPAVLCQPPYMCDHWASIALCMLTHSCMDSSEIEGVTRFSKSPLDQEPMYWNNIEWVQAQGRTFLIPERKKVKLAEKPKPVQESLFDF